MLKDVLILIPAYNEEKNIGKVLEEIRNQNLNADALVIDDGSIDDTSNVSRNKGVKVLAHSFNLGYGAALQTGFKYAVTKGYRFVIQFDADGQHDARDISCILDKLRSENVDIVIGSRFLGKSVFHVGLLKKFAIHFFRFFIRILTKVSITDPTSGLQGLTRKAFYYYEGVGNFPSDFPDADVLIRMIRLGLRVCEIPANIRERDNGKSMHVGLKPVYYFIKLILSILIVLLQEKIVAGEVKGKWELL